MSNWTTVPQFRAASLFNASTAWRTSSSTPVNRSERMPSFRSLKSTRRSRAWSRSTMTLSSRPSPDLLTSSRGTMGRCSRRHHFQTVSHSRIWSHFSSPRICHAPPNDTRTFRTWLEERFNSTATPYSPSTSS